jgi:naphthoate synthase
VAHNFYIYAKLNNMSIPNWKTVKEYSDITYKKCEGVARIAFNRPEVRNAFRPKTTSPKDGIYSFCSGGDQKARGHQGYVGEDGYHRLNILDVQRLIRFMPKAVIAVVPGWAVGGGHSLHVVCDLTLASKENAIFKQTDADVTSFDGGYGSAYLAKMVGQKRAREIFFLGRNYSAQEAFEMGMVNAVVPHDSLEQTAFEWAQEILEKSPTSIKMLKFAMNLTDDGMVGQQVFAGEATRLAYMTNEAKEGRDAFLEKRKPNFDKKWLP